MTEDLEKKLDELLAWKKELDEIPENKEKQLTSSVLARYRRKWRYVTTVFIVEAVIGWGLVAYGLIVMQLTYKDQVVNIDCPTLIIAGVALMAFAVLRFRIDNAKLAILREMKEFETRITEMLQK